MLIIFRYRLELNAYMLIHALYFNRLYWALHKHVKKKW